MYDRAFPPPKINGVSCRLVVGKEQEGKQHTSGQLPHHTRTQGRPKEEGRGVHRGAGLDAKSGRGGDGDDGGSGWSLYLVDSFFFRFLQRTAATEQEALCSIYSMPNPPFIGVARPILIPSPSSYGGRRVTYLGFFQRLRATPPSELRALFLPSL